ncbi:hypothetical protein [Leucobacter tenebrionis]|uniref:hypothetical protein n=1 Tax=Leucobacter tenebrionis TaxID=2873270 RepID=UPI001CA7682A|nr:hypothetical protein [Leucobacter tenebrionis]QZY50875.1 hypothetical protein KVY00_09545 [Leucobacter tenebrionis]
MNGSWAGADIQRSLSGDVPLYLIHRSVQQNQRVPEVMSEIAKANGDRLGLGVIARLPAMTRKTAESFAVETSNIPVRILDPDLYLHRAWGWHDAPEAKSRWRDWKYFDSRPERVSSSWVKTVLDEQRGLNASVLLSASGWVPEANGQRALQDTLNWVRESRQQAGDSRLWVNLTFDSAWLSNRTLRNFLIEEIVESNEPDWYLRFWWPEVSPRYGQLTDESIVRGYLELAYECDNEGKRLYLPNSGLTGWLLSAKGSAGFSTGTAWGEQAFARQRKMGRQPGSQTPPRIPRLFDPRVLHTLQYLEYERLDELARHSEPDSVYLQEVRESGHTPELAGLHYLAVVGDLTAKLNARNPQNAAARLVRQGLDFMGSLNTVDTLQGPNMPVHLGLWDEVLR